MVKNSEAIVCFESASAAIMAEQALLGQSFDVRVMPKPALIQAGCGFCLRILPQDMEKVAAFLSEKEIAGTETYRRTEEPDGTASYRRWTI